MPAQVAVDRKQIREFCQKWQVREFSFFGSVLSENFRPDSDIDVLVTFAAEAPWSLLDLTTMKLELEALFGRAVDLIEQDSLRNPIRRRAILEQREVIHAI